jgi:ABC-type uncharacterized transport system permease subunit
MKKTSCIVAIAIGLAFALSTLLVMAKTSAGKSVKSCGNDKPEANQPTEIRKSHFTWIAWHLIQRQGNGILKNSDRHCAL